MTNWLKKMFELCLYFFRFVNETENGQKSLHQNIVQIFGVVSWPNYLGLVMEYLPGGSLVELLVVDSDVAIGGLLRLRFCTEIACGLAFLHNLNAKRLIHGDLKAENVLLTEDLHCKIADFGSSVLSSYTGRTTTTELSRHHFDFTPIYAAPELLLDPTGKSSPALDIYSFSIIIYLVLKRELPFANKSMQSTYLESIKHGQRPDVSFIDDLSNDFNDNEFAAVMFLKTVMQQCWASHPSSRPAMADVRQRLFHKQVELDPKNVVILQVADTVKNMIIEKPVRSNHRCAPLDMFQLPDCQFQPGEQSA